MCYMVNPSSESSQLYMTFTKDAFENKVGKKDNPSNQRFFFLMPKMFSTLSETRKIIGVMFSL